MKLGAGRHFGEWWGQGIQRNYGLKEKRFSLFNTTRWCLYGTEPKQIETQDPRIIKFQEVLPECCSLVPQIYVGTLDTTIIHDIMCELKTNGSRAVQGFMKPEGIVVYHTAGGVGFKYTIENDDVPKSKLR